MPGFLYAIPTDPSTVIVGEDYRRETLDRFRLDHLGLATLRDAAVHEAKVPGLGRATIIAPAAESAQVTPDQTWHVHRWTDSEHGDQALATGTRPELPTPDDLVRHPDQVRNGYYVQDVSGRAWMIPVARAPDGSGTGPDRLNQPTDQVTTNGPSIPTDLGFGPDGPVRHRKPAWDDLWELSGQIWDYWNRPEGEKDPDWVVASAIRALQAYYRIGPLELEHFRRCGQPVLDDTKAAAITMALINMDLIEDLNAAAGDDDDQDQGDAKKNEAQPQTT